MLDDSIQQALEHCFQRANVLGRLLNMKNSSRLVSVGRFWPAGPKCPDWTIRRSFPTFRQLAIETRHRFLQSEQFFLSFFLLLLFPWLQLSSGSGPQQQAGQISTAMLVGSAYEQPPCKKRITPSTPAKKTCVTNQTFIARRITVVS